jgi:hypothetical protein
MNPIRPAVAAALCVCLPAWAAEPPGTTTIGLDLARETLSGGRADWRERTVRARHDLGERRLAELTLGQTERFGLGDRQIGALYAWPLDAALSASVEANASPSHQVLARNAAGAGLQYEFARAWLLHAGAKSSRYNDARVNQAQLMLEHYVSSYGLAWPGVPPAPSVPPCTASNYARRIIMATRTFSPCRLHSDRRRPVPAPACA